MTIRLDGQVAIVTGAGHGLGRSHAKLLAERGAKVVVNDLGGARDGTGGSASVAEQVVAEIEAASGEAMANSANVADYDQVQAMVDTAMTKWGRVDILVNNAGILRDKTFHKGSLEDFRAVIDVHLMGSVHCTKAVWEIMREQQYGRVVFTTSSSGLYGNFGQSNYGAAKMAMVGLMNTLCLESSKYDIRVNCLAPTAATRMTEDILPPEILKLLQPEPVSAGMLVLVAPDGPNRKILCAGAGGYAISRITESPGVSFAFEDCTPEAVAAAWKQIEATEGSAELTGGFQQSEKFVVRAAEKLGVDLSGGKA